MEKFDEIWRMKHVRKFDEQNFDWRIELGFGITWNERHLSEINSGALNNYFYAPAI